MQSKKDITILENKPLQHLTNTMRKKYSIQKWKPVDFSKLFLCCHTRLIHSADLTCSQLPCLRYVFMCEQNLQALVSSYQQRVWTITSSITCAHGTTLVKIFVGAILLLLSGSQCWGNHYPSSLGSTQELTVPSLMHQQFRQCSSFSEIWICRKWRQSSDLQAQRETFFLKLSRKSLTFCENIPKYFANVLNVINTNARSFTSRLHSWKLCALFRYSVLREAFKFDFCLQEPDMSKMILRGIKK